MENNKLRIGIIGLGDIAQKVYLPFLSKEKNWSIVGAFSPTESKRRKICMDYRIKGFSNLDELIEASDAVFVHSSTVSHFEIVEKALKKGKDVYVDKPLGSTIEEAEKLAELSERLGRKLMVGFNRRFAPMYVKAKEQSQNLAWARIEKHRLNSIREVDFRFTMYDDYIHLVDTARWLGEPINSISGRIKLGDEDEMIFAHHDYVTKNNSHIFIGMHRKAGTNLEQIELVNENSIIRVKNMETMEVENNGQVITTMSGSWDTILKRRGFEDTIMHFINSILGDTKPLIDGEEAFKTQKLVHDMMV